MSKKSKQPRKSYHDKLREMIADPKATFTLEQVASQIGSDLRNAGTAISILKNPKRVKEPFVITRDPATKMYSAGGPAPGSRHRE